MKRLLDAWLRAYEKRGLYRSNPCDRDAVLPLQPLGRALQYFGSACPCCGGTRVLAAAVLVYVLPIALWVMLGLFFVAFIYEIAAGPKYDEADENPGLTD